MKLLMEILAHSFKPTDKEFIMGKCWRVDRRITCDKCWYPYSEARYSGIREYLNA